MMSKNNKEKANIYTYPFATPAAMMLVMKDGGQQELLDQVAMQPDKNYNERVNAYINKVKQVAMDKVQEEMLDTSMGYGEEADAIMSMIPMAQMGMQFSPQAYKTVDAFTKAAKPKNDMGKLFTNLLAPAMFSNAWDQNTDPLDKYYVKSSKVKDATAKDLEKYIDNEKNVYGNIPQAGSVVTPVRLSEPSYQPTYSGVPVTPVKMPQSSYNPQFDETRMLNQISDNEAKYFATQQPNSLDMDWRNQQVVGDQGLYSGQRGVDAWKNKVMNDPAKKNIWNSYSDMPAPLKDIAGDHLFNASSDPRIFTLAAAGAIDMKDSKKYKDDPKLLEATWNQNKGLIQQQYNDDPQAFTSSVSDYRNILYAKSRPKDVNGIPTDLLSNSGTPGLQYNAWSGRTGATQDYIDQAYFGPNTGYVAPQFFMRHGGSYALPMFQSTDFSGENSNIFSAQDGIAVQGSADDEVVDNGDGTISVFSPDGTTRRYASKEQFKKLYKPAAGKTAQVTKELPTTVTDASFTVDPKIAQAAMKNADTPAKKDQTQTTTGSDNPIVDSLKTILGNYGTTPVIDQQTVQQQTQASVGDGLDWFRALVPGGGQRGAIMRGDEPEAFFSPNTVVVAPRGEYRFNPRNIFRPEGSRVPGALKSASLLFGEYDPSGVMVPYGQAPQEYIPVIPNQTAGEQRREERQADRAQRREDKAENIYNRFAEKAAKIQDSAGINNDGTRNRVMREPIYAEFKKGGALDKFLRKAQMGEENPAPGTTKQASIRDYKYEDWINDTDAQIQNQQNENPGVINPTTENRPGILDPKEAKYKLGSKNPFAAPAILAGMNVVAGALENRDAKAQQRELMNRLSFDQMATELRGSDGDYAFNTGDFRPNAKVPVQFTGYNNPMSQFGGAFEKDQEYYLDDNTIQAILNAGGEIEYLD